MACRDYMIKCRGLTVDGKTPFCYPESKGGHYQHPPPPIVRPTKLRPAPCNPPREVIGCYQNPLQLKNYLKLEYPCLYCPGRCTRPCCMHIKTCTGCNCCKYDDPCKAQCYDHPRGIKPSGRYPPLVFRGYKGKCC